DFDSNLKGKTPSESSTTLKEFMMDNMTADERSKVKEPKYFYQITYDKPGGLPMPLIVEYTYADGTTKDITYPAELWRKNDKEVSVVVSSEVELTGVVVDLKAETADIDVTNNSWPKKEEQSAFDKMKEENIGGE
ncbi:MAG TPA: M1 family peptidase, partial [Pricia antarctica]|nr:M1 family peptidase [Pricia antarctica]